MESTLISTPITTVESLRKALGELGLDTRGHKPELKKRLRKAKKKLAKEEQDNTSKKSEIHTSTTITDSLKNGEEVKGEEENQVEEKGFQKQPFDYYLFFDVEATCEEGGSFEYPNEIIEFPIVLVDGRTFEIVCYIIIFLYVLSK
ncbi:hypothetical protein BDC45DRAFT_13312 [Circinella umbellata]|nr:hypothetical protein BDC45DRAFT_13312 [Circinella umbellata]